MLAFEIMCVSIDYKSARYANMTWHLIQWVRTQEIRHKSSAVCVNFISVHEYIQFVDPW